MAVEALQIATVNLASWALLAVGGMSWALDISSFQELKRYARRYTRGNPDLTDQQVEEQFQEELVQLMSKYMSDSQAESYLKKAIEAKRAAEPSEKK